MTSVALLLAVFSALVSSFAVPRRALAQADDPFPDSPPQPTPAGGESGIAGTVTDVDRSRGIPGVSLVLTGTGWEAISGSDGAFAFRELPPGSYELRTRHLAYGPVSAIIEVPARSTVQLEVRLAVRPIAVDPIEVVAVRDARLERVGFYERRRWAEGGGMGAFLGPEELSSIPFARLGQVITHVAGVDLRRVCGTYGCFDLLFARARPPRNSGTLEFSEDSKRGVVVSDVTPCPMRLLVNGADARLFRFDPDGITVFSGVDDLVPVADVAAVEVYAAASAMPAAFGGSDSQCGVVAVWTR